ncbi:hypothetical protein B0H34DRAFT_792416 [Crassisporium funariophilum]|nr:hypothetical protein B0H34DRAFT_792416 [Crassisporium funariophilum]
MLSLPSLLPHIPAITDTTTTPEQLENPFGIITKPDATPIFICALDSNYSAFCPALSDHAAGCYRLLPNRKVLMAHRKKDHNTDDDSHIITWNT